jgi:hypothetical protein
VGAIIGAARDIVAAGESAVRGVAAVHNGGMTSRLPSVLLLPWVVVVVAQAPPAAQRPTGARTVPAPTDVFDVFERSILELQSAQAARRVSSRGLADAYFARIAAYDQAGPRLNAIVTRNPRAREDADRPTSPVV